jgi:hypothetical protein|tara:strand:- start:2418 stop:2972 length:555 start_codon:yes stop_codon:yes gene_type:complete
MPPKKKRRVTPSNHWSAISTICKSNAKLSKQKEDYYALLQQLSTVVEKEWTGPEQATVIVQTVTDWIGKVLQQEQTIVESRNQSLQTMRQVDVLDNDALKSAAASLTEYEFQLSAHKNVINRFSRIVRYKDGSLSAHTKQWLTRFFNQWKTTNNVFNQNILSVQESFRWLEVSFPDMLSEASKK